MDRLFDVGEGTRERLRGPDALKGKTLDRQRITTEEIQQALAVLAAYNEVDEARFEGQVWLRKIIMRLREHPKLTVDEHKAVIARAFEQPWWKGVPTPSVVYGNEALFESALAASRAPRTTPKATTRADMVGGTVRALRDYARQESG